MMGSQGIERRDVMRLIALASVASAFPGFRHWTFACDHESLHGDAATRPTAPYEPLFFTQHEFALVEHLTDLIIPADDKPGARAAGVSEFIDFMVANDADVVTNRDDPKRVQALGQIPRTRFRSGLNWIDAQSQTLYGHAFVESSAEQQTDLLAHLAYNDRYRLGEEEGRAFFQLLREYTVMGFYTSRIGLEDLDYAGLQTAWAEMPACPHKDDPEHLHLPRPVH
jgi:gluconate 2-dehydrogenase gamma chain